MIHSEYEMVCGIEVHIELNTPTKAFCDCSTKFGCPPNTNCCPVCTGMPGALPVLNKEVIEKAIMAGIATNCKINKVSSFDRKNYFYPDLPKAYQITQYYHPLCSDGYVVIEGGKMIGIERIHVEEDAAKIINRDDKLLVDYNRSGVPLIEIVSRADIKTSLEAKAYLEKLQMLMRYIGISDCRMQEGSMRCDVNVSVKRVDSDRMGELVEIKNLNSKKFVSRAIEYEFERQVSIISNGGKITRETRKYDEMKKKTCPIRSKERANDYHYFSDPDLARIVLEDTDIQKIKSVMPENLDQRFARYVNDFGIPEQEAKIILKYRNVSEFFDCSAQKIKNKRIVSNLIVGTIFSELHSETNKESFNINISPQEMIELSLLLENKKMSINKAQSLIRKAMREGFSLKSLISKVTTLIDDQELLDICKAIIEENPKAVADFKSGKDNAIQFLVGAVIKKTNGNADTMRCRDFIIKII